MSPEIKRNKEILYQVPIGVNWIYSKSILGELFEYTFRAENSHNKDFTLAHQIHNGDMSDFLYRLGHAGRDLEGFNEITLLTAMMSKPKKGKLPNQFMTSMALPSLINQTSSQIEAYILSARENPNDDNLGASNSNIDPKLNALKKLAECVPDNTVIINFKRDVIRDYKITQIQTPNIIFK